MCAQNATARNQKGSKARIAAPGYDGAVSQASNCSEARPRERAVTGGCSQKIAEKVHDKVCRRSRSSGRCHLGDEEMENPG